MNKLNDASIKLIDEIVARHQGELGPIKLMLHDVQNEIGYIPFEAMLKIAEATNTSVAEVYGVVTFYAQFTTEPKGKHVFNVCIGTACYVKGAQDILDHISKLTNAVVNKTSPDGLFSIDATRCLGACALAPVIIFDGEVYGNLNDKGLLTEMIEKIKLEEGVI